MKTYRTITTAQLKKAMAGTIAGHEAGNNRRKLIYACKKAGHTPESITMKTIAALENKLADLQYYRDQVNSIQPGKVGTYQAQVKIKHETGETKWLSLNNDSASVLAEFLQTNYIISDTFKPLKDGKLKPEDFKNTDKPKYSVISTHNEQHIELIESGSDVVLNGKYSPGKAYTIKFGNRMVNVRCTSWFQDACIKSSFKKIETE